MNDTDTSPDTKLVTIDEAIKELRIGRDLFYRLIRAGDLPSVKIGARRFVTRADLAGYIRRQRQAARHGAHHV
ncbi:helix-turn-helix domain-containing protein [Pseudactinotalea sp. Z1739]|uniref:helix-turn-helix domain-containing protein n=1 Tax=Pseudactinotalea sp. Z1739 TaxID=3413028 RepID=UPI003C7DD505